MRLLIAAVLALAASLAAYWVLTRPEPSIAPSTLEKSTAAETSSSTPQPSTAPAAHESRPAPSRPKPAAQADSKGDPPGKTLDQAIREASNLLPLSAELRKLPAEELHHTPEPVRRAAFAIGEVAEAVEQAPSRAGEALAFYGDCARRPGVTPSTQALCLSTMRELSRKSGIPAAEDGISPEAKRIADFTMSK